MSIDNDETRRYLYPNETSLYYYLKPRVLSMTATKEERNEYVRICHIIDSMIEDYNGLMVTANPSTQETMLAAKYKSFLTAKDLFDAKLSSTKDLKRFIGLSSYNPGPEQIIRLTAYKKVLETRNDKNVRLNPAEIFNDEEIELLSCLSAKGDYEGLTEEENTMYGRLVSKENTINRTYIDLMEKENRSSFEEELIDIYESIFHKIDEKNARAFSTEDLEKLSIRLKEKRTIRGDIWLEEVEKELAGRKTNVLSKKSD